MATEAGALALGFGSGRLLAGEPADLILLDRETPCNTPLHHVASNAVYSCSGSAVRTVICDGRVLMFDRVVPHEQEILKAAAGAAHRLVERAKGE
jgi:5-methylthioadenosine/S-adenosylhomocysteine deaminase